MDVAGILADLAPRLGPHELFTLNPGTPVPGSRLAEPEREKVAALQERDRLNPFKSDKRYFEELIRCMKSKPGVWFATGEQIARYVKTAELR